MIKEILFEDESLRDGLQFENVVVPFEEKLKLFDLLRLAGVRRIQVGSFVKPTVVPQMADTDRFAMQVGDTPGILVTGLVLNKRGLERAISCGLKHVSLSASVSESHSLKNVRKTAPDALREVVHLIKVACRSGLAVRAGVQCAFGCAYEGAVADQKVIDMVSVMADAGAEELNLADTTGMATPLQVKRLVRKVKAVAPKATLSLHLHDTRGLGLVNMVAGYDAGARIFDTSVGGLGGCPFIKGAVGNVATEDGAHLFEALGVKTHIDVRKLCEATYRYERLLGKMLPGRMSKVLAPPDWR